MYYSLRITPSAFSCPFPTALNLIPHLISSGYVDTKSPYITADEKLDKYGSETDRHFHFNFLSETLKDTLQRRIRKYFADCDYVCRGNTCYALTSFDEPEDINRWLRYCMKEKWLNHHKFSNMLNEGDYTEEDLRTMEALAKDERRRSIEANRKQLQKKQDRETYFDKIIKHLEKKELKDYRSIYIEIARYYVEDKKPVQHNTIKGYTYQYLISHSYISYDDFYNKNKHD